MNLKRKDKIKTVNFINIVEQLNNVTSIIDGSDNKGLSSVQLESVNKSITEVKHNLELLKTDVDKYIDEAELQNSLDSIKEIINKLNDTFNEKLKSIPVLNNANEFKNDNTFKSITTENLNSKYGNVKTINSEIFNINDVKFIDNSEKFSIGLNDKDINLITKGKLYLNGREFKQENSNFTLPSNLVYDNRENNFTEKIKGTRADFNTYSISTEDVITKDNEGVINIGTGDKLNLKVNELSINNEIFNVDNVVKKDDLSNYAELSKDNTFTENAQFNKNVYLKGDLIYDNSTILSKDEDILILGDNNKDLNLLTKGKFKINNNEIDFSDTKLKETVKRMFVILTEDEYNALAEKDNDTIYFIKSE